MKFQSKTEGRDEEFVLETSARQGFAAAGERAGQPRKSGSARPDDFTLLSRVLIQDASITTSEEDREMTKWSIGIARTGQAPELQPFESHSFQHGRELLLAMLSEASECAHEAGEPAEAAALEAAMNDVLEIREPREIRLRIAQHTYWLSLKGPALIQPLSDAEPAREN